ncbi:MAG TPA: zf-HC2 domain-containing protein [Terriglobia bacterium]|nr:zf-HC2 domain-containing protein [Terriglobia bacterium]
MRCKRCQQFLFEYRDKTLAFEQVKLIREHLDDCPVCRAVYAKEEELDRDIHETAAKLQERLHFQFQWPASLDRRPDPAPRWFSFPAVKWATAAITLAVLIVGVKLLIFRHPETQWDRTARVVAPGTAVEQQTQPGQQSENEEGIIQIISIEDASGQVDETLFRREINGVIADITVEVTAVRVEGGSKG